MVRMPFAKITELSVHAVEKSTEVYAQYPKISQRGEEDAKNEVISCNVVLESLGNTME